MQEDNQGEEPSALEAKKLAKIAVQNLCEQEVPEKGLSKTETQVGAVGVQADTQNSASETIG